MLMAVGLGVSLTPNFCKMSLLLLRTVFSTHHFKREILCDHRENAK